MVHSQIIRLLDLVAAPNGLWTKAQVADCHTATLMGIVCKVGLW